MTDNSDFMARYLRPDDSDRHDQPAPPPVDDEEATVVEPQMPAPAPPQPARLPPPSGRNDAAATAYGRPPGGEGAHARPGRSPSSADTGPQPRIPDGPPGDQRSAPPRRGSNGGFQQPAPIPGKPRFRSSPPAAVARRMGTCGRSGRKVDTSGGSARRSSGGRSAHSGRRSGQAAPRACRNGLAQSRVRVHRASGQPRRGTGRTAGCGTGRGASRPIFRVIIRSRPCR